VLASTARPRRRPLGRAFAAWFAIALGDEVVQRALTNSFSIAIPNAILATAFGTMAALGLQRVGKRIRLGFDVLTYMSIIVPEIVIALATLILFATSFDAIESWFGVKLSSAHDDHRRPRPVQHSLVLLLVRARLSGWTGRWSMPARTCSRRRGGRSADHLAAAAAGDRRRVPAVVHVQLRRLRHHDVRQRPGSSTLPLFIFGQVKRGVTPETNAVATMMLAFTLAMLLVGQLFLGWQARRSGRRAGISIGEMVTDA
jgi:spermidine/putrescine transport system permease protein